ncbi:unnamed protein product [Moneuplotes crassus]|uniref:Uncharacterized protein n=1 Tax=Euplotes crassus TaxID=5936 RepID=A0AAD1XA17_EUPCR|nr:unnamed protein product [Moneuplotes crassus]
MIKEEPDESTPMRRKGDRMKTVPSIKLFHTQEKPNVKNFMKINTIGVNSVKQQSPKAKKHIKMKDRTTPKKGKHNSGLLRSTSLMSHYENQNFGTFDSVVKSARYSIQRFLQQSISLIQEESENGYSEIKEPSKNKASFVYSQWNIIGTNQSQYLDKEISKVLKNKKKYDDKLKVSQTSLFETMGLKKLKLPTKLEGCRLNNLPKLITKFENKKSQKCPKIMPRQLKTSEHIICRNKDDKTVDNPPSSSIKRIKDRMSSKSRAKTNLKQRGHASQSRFLHNKRKKKQNINSQNADNSSTENPLLGVSKFPMTLSTPWVKNDFIFNTFLPVPLTDRKIMQKPIKVKRVRPLCHGERLKMSASVQGFRKSSQNFAKKSTSHSARRFL